MDLPVVPAPVRAERREGRAFRMTGATRVAVGDDPAAIGAAVLLAARLGFEVDAAVVVTHDGDGDDVVEMRLTTDPARIPVPRSLAPELAAEAYRLEVDEHRVVLTALDARGLLRGLATLEQVSRPGRGGVVVPPVLVVDHPRFAWRGLCLDVARHWFGPETLRLVVGLLFSLKLNRLHLHLTDDQGWRLEVPSRPALTGISGRTAVGEDPGGFLSVAQYAALTTFADARAVTVVPEIDLPGHVNAALHACPELTSGGQGRPAYTGARTGFSRLCADAPATVPFIRDVLGDVAAMTAGPYVHIGGDEALTMHGTEYAHLVGKAATAVAGAGKTVVAWQEAARVPLPPGSLVQLWDETADGAAVTAAVDAGARLILSPATRLHLDIRSDASMTMGSEGSGHIDLRRAYDWEPGALVGVKERSIAGVEAAIWTEGVRSERDLFTLLLPRLAAVAEVAWSPRGTRDLDRFRARTRRIAARWDALGLAWHRPALD